MSELLADYLGFFQVLTELINLNLGKWLALLRTSTEQTTKGFIRACKLHSFPFLVKCFNGQLIPTFFQLNWLWLLDMRRFIPWLSQVFNDFIFVFVFVSETNFTALLLWLNFKCRIGFWLLKILGLVFNCRW